MAPASLGVHEKESRLRGPALSDGKLRAALRYLLLGLGAAAYLFPFLRVLWRVGDEGTLVYGAQRVAEGAVPYRDFFEVMGPGSFYWLGFFFRVFGSSWLVSRMVLGFTGVATVLLVYWLAGRIGSRADAVPPLLVLTISVPLWPATSHHWDSNLFALAAFALFLLWLERRRSWLLFAAGAVAGLVSLFIQQNGLLLLLSFAAAIWLLDRKEPRWWGSLLRLGAAYCAVGVVTVVLFWLAGALPDLIYANVVWPVTSYRGVNSVPYAFGLWNMFPGWLGAARPLAGPAAPLIAGALVAPFLLVAALPVLVPVLGLVRREMAFGRTVLPFWTTGFALWLAEFHRADMTHLIYGSPILLVLGVFLMRAQRLRIWTLGVRLLIPCTLLFAVFNGWIAQLAQTPIETRRGLVYERNRDEALDFLDREVAKGGDIFVYPYYPMYYFLTGARNPTRYSILMYTMNTDAQFREAVAALEQRKVKYVLWDTVVDGANLQRWFPKYRHPPAEKLIVEPYLMERYRQVGVMNGFRVLRRKEEN
jgi:hypothetical protein